MKKVTIIGLGGAGINFLNSLRKKELKSLPKDDFTNAKKLFDLASQIHDLYYITIIDKLGLKAEILDADGD